MQRYACIDKAGKIIWANRSFDEKPPDPVGKGWVIVPVIDEKPAYDGSTHDAFKVDLVFNGDHVAQIWEVRPKPEPEPDLIEARFTAIEARLAALDGGASGIKVR